MFLQRISGSDPTHAEVPAHMAFQTMWKFGLNEPCQLTNNRRAVLKTDGNGQTERERRSSWGIWRIRRTQRFGRHTHTHTDALQYKKTNTIEEDRQADRQPYTQIRRQILPGIQGTTKTQRQT